MQFTFRRLPPLPSSPFTGVGIFTIEGNEIAASGRRQKQHAGTEAMHNVNGVCRAGGRKTGDANDFEWLGRTLQPMTRRQLII